MTHIDVTSDALADSLQAVANGQPLIQALTNEVTMNDVANLILHWDALPVMADSPGDAGEMADLASALLLNTGQVPREKVDAMHEAGAQANETELPVVLDPVGVGSTPTRKSVVKDLLSAIDFSIIKGNYGEISALAGVDAEVRGVESVGDYDEIEHAARSLADSSDAVVVASGVEDIVAGSDGVYRLTAGHEMLGEVVGTGCMLGATVASFAGAVEDDHVAALHGTLAFGLAGERAAEMTYSGPGSYRTNFEDAVYGFTAENPTDTDLESRVERLN
ncbi:hydroxyethylthiazole kinase [Natronobacterium gregoryi]|uniref:Hydroxyethylthiazole kinase n=2 Tax=Natronobacterium gregoryi TaxID=44930 RepID=L0AG19_NATGS|nr:hydroxyethylthiazole kinase [Natronobacterium gregoryi]AFZ72751.1 hydroxyethylthiazole kinase, sugar kinase family [Natronobacterium gregoryi SP2]ELY69483.1 hydroxyethylthiazole kinase [Natronobacterium gregoryi SP2]PLK21181.1 hydroxyethylthiazole kinase [Natronobacterium gregoryi SP2]SFJ68880.1 hydroxyethylthiazole kinase [Natronobacterium gregoryi]